MHQPQLFVAPQQEPQQPSYGGSAAAHMHHLRRATSQQRSGSQNSFYDYVGGTSTTTTTTSPAASVGASSSPALPRGPTISSSSPQHHHHHHHHQHQSHSQHHQTTTAPLHYNNTVASPPHQERRGAEQQHDNTASHTSNSSNALKGGRGGNGGTGVVMGGRSSAGSGGGDSRSPYHDVDSPLYGNAVGGNSSSRYADVDTISDDDHDGTGVGVGGGGASASPNHHDEADLLAMTDEEKAQFASQLDQWEAVKQQQAALLHRHQRMGPPPIPTASGSGASSYTSQLFKGTATTTANSSPFANTASNRPRIPQGIDDGNTTSGGGGRHTLSAIGQQHQQQQHPMGYGSNSRCASGAIGPNTTANNTNTSTATATTALVANPSALYRRTEEWSKKVQQVTKKHRDEQDEQLMAECTFAPLINKQSAKLMADRTSSVGAMAAARKAEEEELSQRRQRAAEAFRQYMVGGDEDGVTADDNTTADGVSSPMADGSRNVSAANRSASQGSVRNRSAEAVEFTGGSAAASLAAYHHAYNNSTAAGGAEGAANSSAALAASKDAKAQQAAAAANRLYGEHQRRIKQQQQRLAEAEEERRQQCTFTPRVSRKKWASSITPRYLDAYMGELAAREEEEGEDGDDDHLVGDDATTVGRASSVGRSTVLSGAYTQSNASQSRRAGSALRGTSSVVGGGGGRQGSRAPSVRSSSTKGGRRGGSEAPPPLDDNCTFAPVTNSLGKLQQYYKGANAAAYHGAGVEVSREEGAGTSPYRGGGRAGSEGTVMSTTTSILKSALYHHPSTAGSVGAGNSQGGGMRWSGDGTPLPPSPFRRNGSDSARGAPPVMTNRETGTRTATSNTIVAATYTAEPTLNMKALSDYLSLPAHERLSLDAQRKHQTQLEHQKLLDKMIAEQSRPIINPRSAAVVSMMRATEENESAATSADVSRIHREEDSSSNANRGGNTTATSNANSTTADPNLSSFLTRLEAANAKRRAKQETLVKAITALEAPFTPRTNAKYNKVVKSHFVRDADAYARAVEKGEEEGCVGRAAGATEWRWGDAQQQPLTNQPNGTNAAGRNRVIVARTLVSPSRNRSTTGGSVEVSPPAHYRYNAKTNTSTAAVTPTRAGGQRTPSVTAFGRSASYYRATSSTAASNNTSAAATAHKTTTANSNIPSHEASECTFKPTINSSSRVIAKSKYAEIAAAAKRREARLEQLREELALERERKEWGIGADEGGNGASGSGDSGATTNNNKPKGAPAATDLTPRRPFSPSITRRTEALAKGKTAQGAMSLKQVTDPKTDPTAYKQYVVATQRRREQRIAEQREEQRLLVEAELTFKPIVHDVPEHIRAMAKTLRARSVGGGAADGHASYPTAPQPNGAAGDDVPSPRGAGVRVYRADMSSSYVVGGWDYTDEGPFPPQPTPFDGGPVLATAAHAVAYRRDVPVPTPGMRFT